MIHTNQIALTRKMNFNDPAQSPEVPAPHRAWRCWYWSSRIPRRVRKAVETVARIWDEQLLHAISLDTARPTVHARNLFHLSAAMYDAWAAYDDTAAQYLHHENATAANIELARNEAISHAAFNIILHRFVDGTRRRRPGPSRHAGRHPAADGRPWLRPRLHVDSRQFAGGVGQSRCADGDQPRPGRRRQRGQPIRDARGAIRPVNQPLTFDLPGTDDDRPEPLAAALFPRRPHRPVRPADQ